MLSGWLKPKFYNKGKSKIKLTKIRLETVKRKKNAVYKYLKKDIAELLQTGHDYNAYCRIEGVMEECKRMSCYDFIEQFCTCVSDNLNLMIKQRECPEHCREAVASLIYAAARVSEVPELRNLRDLLAEQYGDSLEPFANKKFVAIFEPMPPSREMKIQLMRDIASEFSIQWDSKGLERQLCRQMSNPNNTSRYDVGESRRLRSRSDVLVGRYSRETKNEFLGGNNDLGSDDIRVGRNATMDRVLENVKSIAARNKHILDPQDDEAAGRRSKKDDLESTAGEDTRKKSMAVKEKATDFKPGATTTRSQHILDPESDGTEGRRSKINDLESAEGKHLPAKEKAANLKSSWFGHDYRRKPLYCSSEDESISTQSSNDRDSLWTSSSSAGSVSDDDQLGGNNKKKPLSYRFIPPPYTKPRAAKEGILPAEEKTKTPSDVSGEKISPDRQEDLGSGIQNKPKPRSVRQRFARPPVDSVHLKPTPSRQTPE